MSSSLKNRGKKNRRKRKTKSSKTPDQSDLEDLFDSDSGEILPDSPETEASKKPWFQIKADKKSASERPQKVWNTIPRQTYRDLVYNADCGHFQDSLHNIRRVRTLSRLANYLSLLANLALEFNNLYEFVKRSINWVAYRVSFRDFFKSGKKRKGMDGLPRHVLWTLNRAKRRLGHNISRTNVSFSFPKWDCYDFKLESIIDSVD
jgi:hypothetical protein